MEEYTVTLIDIMRQNTVAFDKFSGLERVEKAKEV
jgi:hypothetical protein